MVKRLNVTGIASELSEGSVFFKRPTPTPPIPSPTPVSPPQPQIPNNDGKATVRTNDHSTERPIEQKSERTNVQLNERTYVQMTTRPDDHTTERPKVRNAFDVYADQIFSLRELALRRSRDESRRVTLGDLVQEALDTFIKQNQWGSNTQLNE